MYVIFLVLWYLKFSFLLNRGKFGVVKRVIECFLKIMFVVKYIWFSMVGSGLLWDDIVCEIDIMNKLYYKRFVGLIDVFEMFRNIVMIMELWVLFY